jgi:hypothetical protein
VLGGAGFAAADSVVVGVGGAGFGGAGFAAADSVVVGVDGAGFGGAGFAAADSVVVGVDGAALVALARAAEVRRVDVPAALLELVGGAAGFGFAAAEAVLVDERGARGAPALGAPTERGEPDVPRRVPVRGRARVAAAARPAPVGGVAAAAGVPGVVGGFSVAWSSCRSSPMPAETAPRLSPTTESMMSFGLMPMR